MLRTMAGMTISVTFPAEAEYLRLARIAAADAASRAGFDIEEIDDLRIAVSESCAQFTGADGVITLQFTHSDGRLVVDGTATFADWHGPDELSQALIEAVVDEHEITAVGDQVRFTLVKMRRPDREHDVVS
jgi:anti-sigma regulatory factor (Ser/Thr protein kinase)